MSIKDLLKNNPGRFVTRAKLWTPDRGSVATEFSHSPLVGNILAQLLVREEPLNAKESTAMKRLLKAMENSLKEKGIS